MANPPAGWYDDTTMADTRRYWDGQAWTAHRQETSAPPPPAAGVDSARRDAISKWEIWGMFAAVFVAPLGLIIGLVLLARGFTRGGWKIVITALVFIALGITLRLTGVLGG